MSFYKPPLDDFFANLQRLQDSQQQKWMSDLTRQFTPAWQLPAWTEQISEMFRSYQQPYRLPEVDALQNTIGRLMESMRIPIYEFKFPDSPVQMMLANLDQQTNKWVGRAFDGFASITPYVLDSISSWAESIEPWLTMRMTETLARYHWWYVPSMPRGLVIDVCDMADAGHGVSIHARICRHYREDGYAALRSMVAGWYDLPYFQKRRRIIDAALKAHMHRDFFLSVTGILPHIEGVAHDFLYEIGTPKKVIDREEWKVIVGVLGISENGAKAVIVESFGDALTEIFFSRYFPNQPYVRGTLVNRHAILHGKLLTYGSEANSLRTFLALETHHHYLKAIRENHSPEDLSQHYRAASQSRKNADR